MRACNKKKTPPLKIEGQGSWIGEAYFLRKGSLVFLAKEQIPVQEADNDDTAEDIADGGRDQIVEDKGSDI